MIDLKIGKTLLFAKIWKRELDIVATWVDSILKWLRRTISPMPTEFVKL
jgi:hypothetical protein